MLEEDCGVEKLHVSLADPEVALKPLDHSGIEKGAWVTVKQGFRRDAASGPNDRLRLRIQKDEVAEGAGALYLDDIASVEK